MTAERKRPWYLVVALLAALALGTIDAREGWGTAALFHAQVDPTLFGAGIADEQDRQVVVSRAEDALHALDASRARGWPFAVATLLLGSATLLFALRALGGSAGARAALVQLVFAQAGLNVASHFFLSDVLEAQLRLAEAEANANVHAAGMPREPGPVPTLAMMRATSRVFLVLRTLGSGLIVLGLTRKKSRDFFDQAPAPVEEP